MLRFRIFGIPVGVHATFLFLALLGATSYPGDYVAIAIWTGAAFVSILMHELGHALVARAFDARGVNITLYGLGGLTSYQQGRAMSHGRSFVISAAGSAVGIVAGGAVLVLVRNGVFDGASQPLAVFINSFIFTALIWGVLNWIPIVPLDGGHMVRHLVAVFNEDKAPLVSQIVTWLAVAIVVPYAWFNGFRFGVVIVLLFAFSGLREYRDDVAAQKAARQPQAPVEPRPAPPADPTPPKPPPEFPI
jgi:Zn-dependent protease